MFLTLMSLFLSLPYSLSKINKKEYSSVRNIYIYIPANFLRNKHEGVENSNFNVPMTMPVSDHDSPAWGSIEKLVR